MISAIKDARGSDWMMPPTPIFDSERRERPVAPIYDILFITISIGAVVTPTRGHHMFRALSAPAILSIKDVTERGHVISCCCFL